MIIWFSLFIPIATIVILLLFFNKRVWWWECLIPLAVSVICISVSKFASEKSQTSDKEYWGAYGTRATYYEEWDEEVSCSHPEYCETTSTDSNGNTITEEYQCGWQHAYDVDFHPAYWELSDSNGAKHGLDQSYFESLCKRWGNRTFFDLNRDFHSIDGDSYVTNWNNEDSTIEAITTLHNYENRVQASNSLFNFQEVSGVDKIAYELFDYPNITNSYDCQNILGNIPKAGIAQRELEIFNSKFGAMKQIRVFVLSFQNQPIEAAMLQENYWKGGNKNEFTICIGTDNDNKITWCYVISWTEVDSLKFLVRDEVMKMKVLDGQLVVKTVLPIIFDKFKRKEFSEFSYITVEPTTRAIVISYVLVLLSSVGMGFWVVMNQFGESGGDSEIFGNRRLFGDRLKDFDKRFAKFKMSDRLGVSINSKRRKL